MANRLIVLAGCAGSGKSTYARQHFPEALVVSSDQYFEELAAGSGQTYRQVWDLRLQGSAHARCRERFAAALGSAAPLVIVDNTNLKAGDRQRFVKLGLDHGYEVEIHVLGPLLPDPGSPTPAELAAYVSLCHGRNLHEVPLEVIDRQFASLDLPSGVYGPGKPAPYLRPLDGQRAG